MEKQTILDFLYKLISDKDTKISDIWDVDFSKTENKRIVTSSYSMFKLGSDFDLSDNDEFQIYANQIQRKVNKYRWVVIYDIDNKKWEYEETKIIRFTLSHEPSIEISYKQCNPMKSVKKHTISYKKWKYGKTYTTELNETINSFDSKIFLKYGENFSFELTKEEYDTILKTIEFEEINKVKVSNILKLEEEMKNLKQDIDDMENKTK